MSRSARVALLILSENRIFRECLADRLRMERPFRIAGVSGVTGPPDLSARVTATRPDVLLVDLDALGPMPEGLLREVRRKHPEIPILALGTLDTENAVAGLLAAGVVGFVSKREPVKTLCHALGMVAAGEAWASRRATARALAGMAEQRRSAVVTLTPRERELLSLLPGGYRNRELALMLKIKEQTVKMHLYRLFQKLHVNSRVNAALKAGELSSGSSNDRSRSPSAARIRASRRRLASSR